MRIRVTREYFLLWAFGRSSRVRKSPPGVSCLFFKEKRLLWIRTSDRGEHLENPQPGFSRLQSLHSEAFAFMILLSKWERIAISLSCRACHSNFLQQLVQYDCEYRSKNSNLAVTCDESRDLKATILLSRCKRRNRAELRNCFSCHRDWK